MMSVAVFGHRVDVCCIFRGGVAAFIKENNEELIDIEIWVFLDDDIRFAIGLLHQTLLRLPYIYPTSEEAHLV